MNTIFNIIGGNQPYQQRARKVLPCLVKQGLAKRPITYSDLAEEIEMPNPRNLSRVLYCIGETLIELSEQINEKIPPIQCLVINKATGIPGDGVGGFISEEEYFTKLSKEYKEYIVNKQLYKIYTYPHWSWVLDELNLEHPKLPNIPPIPKNKKRGGESPSHQELKKYIANNPTAVGLHDKCPKGEIEFSLPSGDFVDIIFTYRGQMVAIEVKSKISDVADIHRGLFQCVKYQAVLEAMLSVQGKPQNVQTLLVLESDFPQELVSIKNMLGVKVLDKIYGRKK